MKIILMDDFPTRITIWLALVAYAGSVIFLLHSKSIWSRRMWTVGCLCYLCHVAIAFDQHHQWSHEIAVARTADQTEEMTGIRTNVGIYVNYFFTVVWVADVIFWWMVGIERYGRRSRIVSAALHLLFVFMVFNGAVVFANGPARWLGTAILLLIAGDWFLLRMNRQNRIE